MKIRRIAAAIAVTAAAVSLAACSAGGTAPEGGQTVTIASNADPLKNLDRFDNFGFGTDDTFNLFSDPLVTSDHHGNYEPALALEWEHSDDHLTWTFQLRRDVEFSSGNPFTADDVVVTFERLRDHGSELADAHWDALQTIEASDDETVVITLANPMVTILDELVRTPILDGAAYEADPDGYFLKPSGTGAFTIDSFSAQTSELRVVKNEDWWGWTDDNKTNVDTIVYKTIGEDSTRAAELQSGSADIATQLSVETAQSIGDQFELADVDLDTHMHLAFQAEPGALFEDKNLREAFSLSVDRSQLVDGILAGQGVVSTWPVVKGNLGYQTGEYSYDPDRAADLVADSAYDGSPVSVMYSQGAFPRVDEIAQTIQAEAAKAGFEVKLEPLEQAAFNERRDAGDYDIMLGAFAATAGDPQVELSVIINFNIFKTNYQNDELAALASQAMSTVEPDEREELFTRAFEIEMNEFAPFVYLYDGRATHAMAKGVTGVSFYADSSAQYKFVNKE
jgi:peptide/nickel transport system substrate-binding protein/glutathione transport system substrate-binding protein